MNGLQNDWYVAGADGEAIGPLARTELARRHAAGQFGRDALAWHVDHAEWLPLSRVVVGLSSLAAGPVPAAPEPPSGKPPSKPERKAERGADGTRRPPPPARQTAIAADARQAKEARQLRELRERLAASTAAAGASAASVRAKGERAIGEAKADAAQSAQRLQQAARRLFARTVDVLWIGVPLATLAAIAFGLAGTAYEPETPDPFFLLWAALFVLVPLEAVMLAAGGRTPGKALLGLRVSGPRGNPGFGAAWARSTTVLWRGVGLGIPPLTIIAAIVGGVQLLNDGEAPWDRAQGLSTRAEPLDNRGLQFAFVAVLLGVLALAGGLWSELAYELLAATATP